MKLDYFLSRILQPTKWYAGTRKRHHEETAGGLQRMPVRNFLLLHAIREQHGSAIRAAMAGAINAEEYLKLERISDQ